MTCLGAHMEISCMMPLASACALKDMFFTCRFTGTWVFLSLLT